MKTQTEIINFLFDLYGFTSYLEIGVRNPSDNFDKISAIMKHGVDPNPKRKYSYNMTSDDFFQNYVNQKYDVIFIDGLHTEEQSYKDIKNSICNLKDNGYIIIHDCNPNYEFKTRSYDDYLKKPGAWNGTVYKAFLRSKYELKDWSCFVIDENQGCGILTQRKILENKIVNDFDVNDFSWKQFSDDRVKLLQLISFDNYVDIINKDFNGSR